MKTPKPGRLVNAAALLALLGLALMTWSLLDRRPLPVVVWMTVGQIVGTLSLGLYLVAIALDLRGRRGD